ncbi:BglG family transcription antiterminator [Streptococcus iniae]|uniref:BglG family transcription antiterminator n=1 Tax=Streptococcus iniae TaxID=1346 RepID=UPI00217F1E9E|nr:HTH domain-containing protein [Streptococcus iniae]
MLLTKREEQLMKAFLSYGKLSIDNMEEILKVSRRTVYRVLNDLTISLNSQNISIIKEDQKYFFTGQLDVLQSFSSQESFSKVERLNLMTYYLLTSQSELTNDFFQEEFAVSNVTIIQDIAEIETRLSDFDVQIKRQKGYSISDKTFKKRWLLAILLSNNISLSDFWQMKMGYFDFISADRLVIAKSVFQKHQSELPEMDSKLLQFFIILLALSNWQAIEKDNQSVSKLALDFSQKVFADFSSQSNDFYPISEILYFAKLLDLLLLKRQETPLFQENFDSEFFYNVSNLIDKVALYTKINFTKDQTLFKFLFNHIRLSLAVPILFADSKVTDLAHEALRNNEYLHRVIQLLVMEIFPNYLQTEWELELITLHFASSLRRSPQIYPVRILLLTDERPLATELLVSRLKNIAPFIESIATKACSSLEESDFDTYDAILATKLLSHDNIQFVSTYPNPSEMLGLEEFLQDVQINRDVKLRESQNVMMQMDFKDYFNASQLILKRFYLKPLNNRKQFNHTIDDIIQNVDMVSDKEYLTRKLNKRFNESPMAIPETNLALIHWSQYFTIYR